MIKPIKNEQYNKVCVQNNKLDDKVFSLNFILNNCGIHVENEWSQNFRNHITDFHFLDSTIIRICLCAQGAAF